MIKDKKLTANVIKYGNKIGLDIIGFADPKDFNRFKDKNRPERYLSTCKTVIIAGIFLYDMILDTWSEDKNTKKSFHFLDSIIENRLGKLKEYLQQNNYKSVIISYAPGLFLKDAGALAGLGPIGKNNLLLTQKFGSQIRLRALVTEAPLITGHPVEDNRFCRDCSLCMDSCPINALEDGIYNKELCLSYNLLNLVKITDYTSIWCNICIEACPYSKKVAKINFK